MTGLYLKGNSFVYELQNVARMFTPTLPREGRPDRNGQFAYCRVSKNTRRTRLLCCVRLDKAVIKTKTLPADAAAADCELSLAVMLFESLSLLTGTRPPWGVMTGVRPAKFAAALVDKVGRDETERVFQKKYLVSKQKTSLALAVADYGRRLEQRLLPDGYSLYVSIPFCPTRCGYCSFVSQTIEREGSLVSSYLDCLIREIAAAPLKGRTLQTVYIGGGTPTVLSAQELTQLLSCIAESFDLSRVTEYTVEAGRPDTVTAEKLDALKRAGVTRVSINPQTTDDAVLRAIGRRHTHAETLAAYAMARERGFIVNCDLIAGLPTDTEEGFRRSLDGIMALAPQNITVHSLTIKRASFIRMNKTPPPSGVADMLDYAYARLTESGYAPYYMYKQKGTVENLENTGFCMPFTECRYNAFIMDEVQTIVAVGAGAVGKSVSDEGIRRVYNYKLPLDYIADIEREIARHADFYN